MKPYFFLLSVVFLFAQCAEKKTIKVPSTPKILVFSKTEGYRHESIEDGIAALQKIGKENNFVVAATENADFFHEDTLKNFAAVVFLSTTGDVLNHKQQADFERYIQSGGGFVGIHAATDTEYDWQWYTKLVGGQFESHPAVQSAKIMVKNHSHAATKHLDGVWQKTDEWYNFKNLNKDVKLLMSLDETSYKDGKMGDNHPIAWYHDYDGGRAFYTALGHTTESYSDKTFLQHLAGGIKYAIGSNKRDLQSATTLRVPADERFTKTILADGLYEPTEMTVLPNGDVLLLERRGNIKLYSAATKNLTTAGFFDVYYKTSIEGVNAEEGMLGITIDPDFAKNQWVYIFYSPADASVNRLSRFKFQHNQIVKNTEQKILEMYSQREICCHTGGSLAFGPDGLLYLSTGDNATPFDEANQKYVNRGFSPTDDRPGHEQYDARRTSANTNDLRGKILRIKIEENGTYSIPKGNLFPVGTPKTRPEIYVMGCRNPYRLSIDAKRNFLFWGEVGPDASRDSMETRGPRGYDEVNMARKAGFYGWPLFVGNNYAYHAYDYASGQSGAAYDPQKPINNSRNNTGLQELPPTNPATIWYPYAKSTDFPMLGSGGRNAMAGPIYYAEKYPKATRLPDYYNGKVLIYDWMRAWIFAVTIDKQGNYQNMEPFAPNIKMACPIDMEMGPDGKIYVLDYGKGWFTQNIDATLYTIEYHNENLPPQPVQIIADKIGGKPPIKVHFDAIGGKDPENDKLIYRWHLGFGTYMETKTPQLDFSFPVDGQYNVSLEIFDEKKASVKSNSIVINAGNDVPRLDIALAGNAQFYFPELPPTYSINIEDTEDGSLAKGIDKSRVMIKSNYIDSPDKSALPQGHQTNIVQSGQRVMEASDCQSCHKLQEKSIGPSFAAVAARYPKTPQNIAYITKKIINGGGGVWGETAMSAHPSLTVSDANAIAGWVLGLGKEKAEKSLPLNGKIALPATTELKDNGLLVLNATYIDKNEKPQTGFAAVELRHPLLQATDADKLSHCRKIDYEQQELLAFGDKEGSFLFKNIDLTGVKAFELHYGIPSALAGDYTFEARLDSPQGTLIGSQAFGTKAIPTQTSYQRIATKPVTDRKRHDVYFIFRRNNDADGGIYVGKVGLKAI
jgi:cytochrome c